MHQNRFERIKFRLRLKTRLRKIGLNGTLERKLREYVRPQLLLLDELGYLPIDGRGADLMFQVVAAR